MPWGAAAVVGAAAIGAYASNSAANKQSGAENRATDIANNQYEQTRNDNLPALNARNAALAQLTAGTAAGGQYDKTFSGMGDLSADPGYQFRMDQGMKAVDHGAAAAGGVLSGATLKAEQQYGQGFASNEYQNSFNRFQANQTNSFNRLAALAGIGQTGANTIADAGARNAADQTSAVIGGANASAAGTVGVSNSISNGASSLANWYQQQQLLSKLGTGNNPGYQVGGLTSQAGNSNYLPASDASWSSYTGG